MQPHNFYGILFLIDMVRRPENFAEASLSDQGDVLKFLVEPPGVKNVVQGWFRLNLTHDLCVILRSHSFNFLEVFNLNTDLALG